MIIQTTNSPSLHSAARPRGLPRRVLARSGLHMISGFPGCWLTDTFMGPRFEEAKTHIEESRDDFAERREPYP